MPLAPLLIVAGPELLEYIYGFVLSVHTESVGARFTTVNVLAPSKFSENNAVVLAGINKLLEFPRQIVAGDAVIVPIGVALLTVIVALPVLPAAFAVQFASVKVAMV